MEGLEFWNKVSETNPDHTKHVAQRGGFTSIDAHSQILAATEQWGPVGGKWHWDVDLKLVSPEKCEPASVWLARVSLYHACGERPVVQFGCKAYFARDKPDEDAPKKAVTDGLTKCLSYLGFNADVFLGKFDDNKYVQEMRAKFGNTASAEQIQAIEDLAIRMHGSGAEAHVQNILHKKGMRSLDDLTSANAKAWAATLEIQVTEKEAANEEPE